MPHTNGACQVTEHDEHISDTLARNVQFHTARANTSGAKL